RTMAVPMNQRGRILLLWSLGEREARPGRPTCQRTSEKRLRRKQLRLDGKHPLFALKKNSLCRFGNFLALYASNYNIRLHHRVLETERLFSITATLNQNISAFSGSEAA